MKAIQFSRFGGTDVLELVDLPVPVPGPGQILVRVAAWGVNFADILIRQDRYAVTPALPAIPGNEVAGLVEAVGPGVAGFAPSDRVLAPLFAAGRSTGGYADFVLAEAEWAVPIPDAMSFDDAVALAVQGLTALHLVRRTEPAGRTVLVTAAAGGVGSLLVPLAREAGARRVVGAASTPQKRALVRSLGADEAIDYTAAGWTEALRAAFGGDGPDIVYELTGGAVTEAALEALAPGGEMVIFGALNIQSFAFGVPELMRLIFRNQSVTGFALVPLLTPETIRTDLGMLFDLAAAGRLTPRIGAVHPLSEAARAHAALGTRGSVGKVILRP